MLIPGFLNLLPSRGFLDSNSHQPHLAWPIVRDDGGCSSKHGEGTKLKRLFCITIMSPWLGIRLHSTSIETSLSSKNKALFFLMHLSSQMSAQQAGSRDAFLVVLMMTHGSSCPSNREQCDDQVWVGVNGKNHKQLHSSLYLSKNSMCYRTGSEKVLGRLWAA